jgi:hypothetical protein
MAAQDWIGRGYGYQITAGDLLEAYSFVLNAHKANEAEAQIKIQIRDLITEYDSGNNILLATLRDRV